MTSESQKGWKAGKGGPDVRGAYANMLNPLNVPIRIVNMSANTYLDRYLKYDVTLLLVDKYKCAVTNEYAHIHIGAGINKTDPSITWVDVEANKAATFFTIAEPFVGSGERRNSSLAGCMGLMPFSCCFATMTAAYVCKLNPSIGLGFGEIEQSFMPLKMYSNITLLIDMEFEVEISYNEDLFPIYFGYEVYQGYIDDAELDCGCYKFYDVDPGNEAISH